MTNENKEKIQLPSVVPVKLLAEKLYKSPSEIIKKLIENGVMATINESIDFDTAAIIADEFGFEAQEEKEDQIKIAEDGSKDNLVMENKPPVVTVMGHVDHGKTKLLDAIRNTNVTATESGGITQHIGAYQVEIETAEKNKKIITFLDTPGHEAFSKMRAQGANITDIVILVVAADEGVKPQTIEAISHAKAAKAPIIVAINKIDKPEADPDRVKRELSEYNLVPEEWSGKTPMVPVSALTGKNIKELLELILLTADIEELKAPVNKPAKAMVIESKILPGKGPVATAIVQEGILKTGEVIICDDDFAKIRFLEDWTGKRIKEARPADPVLIAGFKKTPKVGSVVKVVKDEKTARVLTQKMRKEQSVKTIKRAAGLAEISKDIKGGEIKELNIILKADTKGSLDAIKGSLEEIEGEGIKASIISDGIGTVSESDVNLAIASFAVILAFRVPVPPNVLKLAEANKIKISKYDIIYELIDDVTSALEGLLEPEIVETKIGKLRVLKIFKKTKNSGIIGGKVISGKITPGTKIIVKRNDETIGELKTQIIQVGNEKVNLVEKGSECGISFSGDIKVKPEDILEFILIEEKVRSLKKK